MRLIILSLFLSLSIFGSPQGVPGRSAMIVGSASTQILGDNLNRGYLIVQNQGASTTMCQLVFGVPISGSEGLQIFGGQNYESVEAFVKTAVYMKCGAPSTVESVWTNY